MKTFTQDQLEAGQLAIARFHNAIIQGDRDGAGKIRVAYLGQLAKLSGHPLVGSEPGTSVVGEMFESALAAPDGMEPAWGQRGRFLVQVDGVPILVKTSGLGSAWGVFTFVFYALSTKAPFIAPRGLRTHHCAQQYGKTPRECAIDELLCLVRTDLRPMDELPEAVMGQLQMLAALPFVMAALSGLSDPVSPMLQLPLL